MGKTPFKMAFGTEVVVPVEVGVSSLRRISYDEQSNDEGLKLALPCLPEVKDTFLEGFLGVLGGFSIGGESLLHDPANVRNRKKSVLLMNVGVQALIAALVVAASSVQTR